MTMQQVLPYLVQTASEIGKEVLISAVRSHLTARMIVRPTVSAGESPRADHGCPYCAVAKVLGVTWFYLIRAARKPDFAPIYLGLAAKQVSEAISVLDRIPGEPDVPTMRLSEQLVKLDVALSRPVTAPDYAALAETVMDIMEFDMGLAERYNASESTGDQLAARVDERLKHIEVATTGVIDGEVISGP